MMAVASLIQGALMLALPALLGWWAGNQAARACKAWYAHAALGLGSLFVVLLLQYAGLYFAVPLWVVDAREGNEPPITLRDLARGFAFYAIIGAITAAPIILGGYLVGYFRSRDRGTAPKALITFPEPLREGTEG